MSDLLFIPIALIYLVVVGLLFIYGINYFYITYLAWHYRGRHLIAPAMTEWPRVTVQLPIYNEMYVAERLIKAAAEMDYPKHLLEIQVLDDSTDETQQLTHDLVLQLQAQGINITHLHRDER
ncbi:MAG: hypothetical protein LUO89_13005, partial [Methanothrix sp.]|nr:hypothetical protein [Methanothrix sp.]